MSRRTPTPVTARCPRCDRAFIVGAAPALGYPVPCFIGGDVEDLPDPPWDYSDEASWEWLPGEHVTVIRVQPAHKRLTGKRNKYGQPTFILCEGAAVAPDHAPGYLRAYSAVVGASQSLSDGRVMPDAGERHAALSQALFALDDLQRKWRRR